MPLLNLDNPADQQRLRQASQGDPVPNLTKRWGEITAEARKRAQALEDSVRDLDTVTDALAEHGCVVATDLGGPGNAFRHAAQAARDDRDRPAFTLHGPGAA